jgi:hypothetical protein
MYAILERLASYFFLPLQAFARVHAEGVGQPRQGLNVDLDGAFFLP